MNKVPLWQFRVINSILMVVSLVLLVVSLRLGTVDEELDESRAAYDQCVATSCKCAEPEATERSAPPPEVLRRIYESSLIDTWPMVKHSYAFPMVKADDSYIFMNNPPFSKEDIKKQLQVVCVGGFQYWFGFQGVSAIMAPRFGVQVKGKDPVPLACFWDPTGEKTR